MAAKPPEPKKSRQEWRQRCIEEFALRPLPESWSNGRLSATSEADDETWRRYHEFRTRFAPKKKGKHSDDKESEDEDEDEGYSGDYGDKALLSEVARHLEEEVGELLDELIAPTSPSSTSASLNDDGPSKKERQLLAKSFLDHAYPTAEADWDESETPRSAEYLARIFSPYALPRAVVLRHRFHSRSRNYSCEFYVTWEFKILRFDGEEAGDAVQERLAETFPKGWNFGDDSPCFFDAESGYERLCSNEYVDPPYTEEEKGIDWVAVEKIDVTNLTPTTVRRIRGWLYGSPHKSMAFLDDFAFLRLLFASCGSSRFSTNRGQMGYQWRSYKSAYKEEIEEVKGENDDFGWYVNWLQHHVRTITGTLRPIDRYYEPYDELQAKGEWGRQVLQWREEQKEGREEDEDDEEDQNECPWVVWEREEERSRGGGMQAMLQMLGNMR